MKPFSKLKTFTNAAGEETWSTFYSMFVETYPEKNSFECVITFHESRLSDGEWNRDYKMFVLPYTMLKVFHYVDGLRVPLMSNAGIPTQVVADEFTLMRFMCWDHNFASLKQVIEAGILRRKAAAEALRLGQEPAPHDYTLPPPIPPAMLIDYLADIYSE